MRTDMDILGVPGLLHAHHTRKNSARDDLIRNGPEWLRRLFDHAQECVCGSAEWSQIPDLVKEEFLIDLRYGSIGDAIVALKAPNELFSCPPFQRLVNGAVYRCGMSRAFIPTVERCTAQPV